MWTTTVVIAVLASFVLLSEASFDDSPPFPPPLDTTITCMVPGNYRGKRFVSPPDRMPQPEDTLELQLVVGQIDEYWELPPINFKPPGVPNFNNSDFTDVLDAFLNATNSERLVVSNRVDVVVPDLNNIFGRPPSPPFEVPGELLTGMPQADIDLIRQYVADAEIGECMVTNAWRRRPPFYYPRFQVYGRCDGRDDCSIPITSEHSHSQRCRPDLSENIRIRALRWDCCHSYTTDGNWEYICGWRVVSVPIINGCTCSCDPNEA